MKKMCVYFFICSILRHENHQLDKIYFEGGGAWADFGEKLPLAM